MPQKQQWSERIQKPKNQIIILNDIFQKMGYRFPNSVEKCGTIPLILLLPATPAPASIPNYGVLPNLLQTQIADTSFMGMM